MELKYYTMVRVGGDGLTEQLTKLRYDDDDETVAEALAREARGLGWDDADLYSGASWPHLDEVYRLHRLELVRSYPNLQAGRLAGIPVGGKSAPEG